MNSSGQVISKIIKSTNYYQGNSIQELGSINNQKTLTITAEELNIDSTLDLEGNAIINCSTINELNSKVNKLERQVLQLISVVNYLTGKNLS